MPVFVMAVEAESAAAIVVKGGKVLIGPKPVTPEALFGIRAIAAGQRSEQTPVPPPDLRASRQAAS